MAGNSSSMDASSARARIVARYDSLLEALGEDPFHATSALQRTEDAAKVVDDAQTAAQRKKLLAAAAQKSLRCAELIEQALDASAALSSVQRKIARAHKAQQNGDNDDNDSDASSEDDDDEDVDMDSADASKTALLLEDLVAAGDEMQEASKKYAHLGVADKTARASRALLSLADQSLHESVDALATGAWDGSSASSQVQSAFRDLYMDAFTSAFGDDLDQFRQEERFESRDVSYLISCIHAGGDVFTPLQKSLFVESMSSK